MMPRAQSTLQIALVDSIYSVGFICAVATCDGLGFREFSKRSTYLSQAEDRHFPARVPYSPKCVEVDFSHQAA
jgi:predicted nucleotide-binding protein